MDEGPPVTPVWKHLHNILDTAIGILKADTDHHHKNSRADTSWMSIILSQSHRTVSQTNARFTSAFSHCVEELG